MQNEKLEGEFPEITEEELLEVIDEIFETGADSIPAEEIFSTGK